MPGAPQTALSNLMAYYPLGGFGRRLGSERHRHCCRLIIIGTYKIDPIRRYHAGKKPVFNTPRQSLSHPRNPIPPKPNGIWWRCRVPPPGPKRLLHRSFISIAASSSCILAKVFPKIQPVLLCFEQSWPPPFFPVRRHPSPLYSFFLPTPPPAPYVLNLYMTGQASFPFAGSVLRLVAAQGRFSPFFWHWHDRQKRPIYQSNFCRDVCG